MITHRSLLTAALCLAVIGVARPPASFAAPPETGPLQREARLSELVKAGNEARRAGRIEAAITAYTRARDVAPRRYEVRVLLADTLRRSGRPEQALAEYRAAVSIEGARAEGYTGEALIRRAAYDYEGAAGVLERALVAVDPGQKAGVLVTLAETRRRQGLLAEAGQGFRVVLKTWPEEAAPRAGLAQIAEARGDLEAAIAEWDLYLKERPEDEAAALRRRELRELKAAIAALRAAAGGAPGAGLHAELGRLLRIAGDAGGAAAAYRRALALEPRDLEARRGLALALRASDAGAAAAEFRAVLGIAPDDGVALYNLVSLARAAGDAAGEEAAWSALLASRPDDLFAARACVAALPRLGSGAMARALEWPALRGESPARLRLRAWFLGVAGRGGDAADLLYRALRTDTTDPWTLDVAGDMMALRPDLLGALLERARVEAAAAGTAGDRGSLLALLARLTWWSGRVGEALILARQAVAVDPASAVAQSALAEAYQEIAHDAALARQAAARALELDPQRPAAHVDLALMWLRAGRAREAETAARRALEVKPTAPAWSVLGRSLADQGDLEGAAAGYAAALRADPVDNFGLARSQYPLILAALGRHVEARQALQGDVPPLPEALYAEAWRFARDSYRDRRFNGVDWAAWRDRPRPATTQEAYRDIAVMLASLGDPHTRLRDWEETAATYLGRRGDTASVDALGRVRPHSRTVTIEEGPDGLGYIRLGNLADPRVVEEVRRVLLEMRTREGIILDLRGNPGGSARAADAIGDLLVGPGKEVGVDLGPEGAMTQLTGGDGALTDAPLTVLVDGQTGSAAERLARTLAASGRASLVGNPTRGKGLAQTSRVLPGGMTVLVSVSEMLGPDGRPLQGRGLKPRLRSADDAGPPRPPDHP